MARQRLAALVSMLGLLSAVVAGPMQTGAQGMPAVRSPNGASQTVGSMEVMRGSVSAIVASGKAARVGSVAPDRILRLALVYRPRKYAYLSALAASGQRISAARYQAEFAPTVDAIQAVHGFAHAGGLQVLHQFPDLLLVQGTAAQVERALHLQMNEYRDGRRTFYANATDPVLPANVAADLTGVVGLTEVPYTAGPVRSLADPGATGYFTPDAVRAAYGLIPAYGNGITGKGRNIAIIMSGGFSQSDVQNFSQTFGIPYDPTKITAVNVPGTPAATTPPAIDGESTLDVQWSHALAPDAAITEYQSGDLQDANLLAALDAAITASARPDAINLSFGSSEVYLSASNVSAWHTLLVKAVTTGITPVAASGDTGAYGTSGDKSVSHPASDPLVLAVGGTSLSLNPDNTRSSETAWGEAPLPSWDAGLTGGSGGGCSVLFSDLTANTPQGASQTCGAGVRGVPDVSMLAQNIEMVQGGQWQSAGGTSFAAPMWSAILALAAQKAGHGFGWVRPAINAIAQTPGVFNDVTSGNNGVYSAGTGWDAVTGWGSPGSGWTLVQALAKEASNPGPAGPSLAGFISGASQSASGGTIANGNGAVDLIGSGFGSTQGNGTVTLTNAGGTTYNVPITTWSDSDITLNIDSTSPSGLFSLNTFSAGTYTLTVTTGGGATSNPLAVKLQDFFRVTDNGPTPVTLAGQTPAQFQTLTINAYTPDGRADGNVNTTASLDISPVSIWKDGTAPVLTVQQNGQTIQPAANGSYPVTVTNGVASVQVATTGAIDTTGTYRYTVMAPAAAAGGIYPGSDSTASFTPAAASALGTDTTTSVADWTYAPVGTANPALVSLLDANGNLVQTADRVTVSVYGASTGNVSINGTQIAGPGATVSSTSVPLTHTSSSGVSYNGYTYLQVADNTAETVTLNVYDPTIHANLHLPPLTFTQASQVAVAMVGSATTPVSDSTSPVWQTVQVSAQDAGGTAVGFPGIVHFFISGSGQPGVEEQVTGSGIWQPLTYDPSFNGYALDLSQGPATVRVATMTAGTAAYSADLHFGSGNAWNGGTPTGTFTPGSESSLTAAARFPHMATSPAATPQYDAVQVAAADTYGNPTTLTGPLTLTETGGGPTVAVAVYGANGSLQAVTPAANGTWTITPSPSAPASLYIASVQTGVASFTVADATYTATDPLQIDFVNSVPTRLSASAPTQVQAGGTQTVKVNVVDQSGQTVINNSDQIALSITGSTGQVTVTDATYNPLTANAQGQYLLPAAGGATTFRVTDTHADTLSYALSDVTQSQVTGANTTGTFAAASTGGAGGGGIVVSGGGGGGGASPQTPTVNQPTLRSPTAVQETLDTTSQDVTLSTSDQGVEVTLPKGTLPAQVAMKVTQVASVPQTPADTVQVAPAWSFDIGGAKLQKPVTVTFKIHALPAGVALQQLAVYTEVNGTWQFYSLVQPGPTADTVTATLPHFSVWTVMAIAANFPDVPASHWAFSGIEELLARNAIHGYPDGTFQPEGLVTRAEFVAMLDRTLGVNPVLSGQPFGDVSKNAWYAPFLDAAYQAGFLKGDAQGLAHPDAPITREEMATILARVLGPGVITTGPANGFRDSGTIAPWASTAVQAAVSQGLLQGYPDGAFQPLANLKRDEATAVVVRLIHAKGIQ